VTDSLLNFQPILTTVTALFADYAGPLGIILAVYLGLFVLGLIFEAMRSSKSSNKPDV
jgi:hypothetical protein